MLLGRVPIKGLIGASMPLAQFIAHMRELARSQERLRQLQQRAASASSTASAGQCWGLMRADTPSCLMLTAFLLASAFHASLLGSSCSVVSFSVCLLCTQKRKPRRLEGGKSYSCVADAVPAPIASILVGSLTFHGPAV